MSVTYANNWDAAKLMRQMSKEELEGLRAKLQEREAANNVMGRRTNTNLLHFVEQRLEECGA